MNRVVRLPSRRSPFARATTSLTSFTPEVTALNATNRLSVDSATRRASVVLPDPGGPQKIIEGARSSSINLRNGASGAVR